MTEEQASELVDSLIPDGWWKGTPESLVETAMALSDAGWLRTDIETLLERIVSDIRREYGD